MLADEQEAKDQVEAIRADQERYKASLEESFENGDIAEPRYIPDWARNPHAISAYLAFSALVDHVDLHAMDLEDVPRVVAPRSKLSKVPKVPQSVTSEPPPAQ